MLGKTNILFVSKNDASEAQLIHEKILTASSGNITKIEFLNNTIFVHTDAGILRGTDVKSMDYLKKDGANLAATHFIFHAGKYYFCDASQESQEKAVIYATEDFSIYEEIVVEENGYISETEKVKFIIPGIFKDSRGRIVIMVRKMKGNVTYQLNLYIFDTFEKLSSADIVICDNSEIADFHTGNAVLIKDRIFSRGGYYGTLSICSLDGKSHDAESKMYANDYFFKHTTNNTSKTLDQVYKSFDGLNWSKVQTDTMDAYGEFYIFPLNGKTCLKYCDSQGTCYIKMADGVNKVGSSTNETFEIDIQEKIYSVAEDDEGNTYIGCSGGIINKISLDKDGTTQLPDVQLIKTLAAKQALAQAKQYTDEKVAELKVYIDSKLEQNI